MCNHNQKYRQQVEKHRAVDSAVKEDSVISLCAVCFFLKLSIEGKNKVMSKLQKQGAEIHSGLY